MNISNCTLIHGDCIEEMKKIPSGTVDMVIADPPYNIGVVTQKRGKKVVNEWDVIDNYIEFMLQWLGECCRVLKDNGVLYVWHNDIVQISKIQVEIEKKLPLTLKSFCIWDKGNGYRARTWVNRDPYGKTAPRSWFNICEYCLHYFKNSGGNDAGWKNTGLDRIMSNPSCFQSLKQWYANEKERLGLTDNDIAAKYTEVTGKKPHMLQHYFRNSQFELPTKKVWESVYQPLGFGKEYEELRKEYEELRKEYEELRKEYEELRKEYEELRKEYEELRNYHRCDERHCNIWHIPPIPTNNRFHTCQKPLEILQRLLRVSLRPGGVVLDPFMGSGSTGVACINENARFIGIEKDEKYFHIAKQRIHDAAFSNGVEM